MEGIKVKEINNVDPNNTKESFVVPDNEKSNKEINVGNQEVKNYEGKGAKKVLKVLTFVLTLGSAGLLGGTLLSNAFVGKEPTLANIRFERGPGDIHYSFEIKEIGTLDLALTIRQGEETIHEKTFENIGTYSDVIEIIGSEELVVTLAATNGIDYLKVLYEETL